MIAYDNYNIGLFGIVFLSSDYVDVHSLSFALFRIRILVLTLSHAHATLCFQPTLVVLRIVVYRLHFYSTVNRWQVENTYMVNYTLS